MRAGAVPPGWKARVGPWKDAATSRNDARAERARQASRGAENRGLPAAVNHNVRFPAHPANAPLPVRIDRARAALSTVADAVRTVAVDSGRRRREIPAPHPASFPKFRLFR